MAEIELPMDSIETQGQSASTAKVDSKLPKIPESLAGIPRAVEHRLPLFRR